MKSIQEKCGLFGLYSSEECVFDVCRGIDFLQHRGQRFCGIATCEKGIHLVTHHGKVGETFTTDNLNYLKGTFGIGHVSLWERQPIHRISNLGEISVAFSGNIINSRELVSEMMAAGGCFLNGDDIEIISQIIISAGDPVAGILAMAEKIKGAYSLLILTQKGIYATRDVYGLRPLILGKRGGRYAASSESRAITNLDMEVYRDVMPGEIVFIDGHGFETIKQLHSPCRAYCAFEWAYTASIDSIMENLPVQQARNSMGASLAQRDIDEGGIEADIVAPVPMSGCGHALGYHMRSNINYQEVYLYNRYADRSYTQVTQVEREKMAKRKLSVLTYGVKDQKIILCDDSIVRGTQIYNTVQDLKRAGAVEVHVRVACPPLMYPCDFGISTRSTDELIARKFIKQGSIDSMKKLLELEAWVADQIHADSVKYNSLDNFVSALGIPKNNLCLKCWDGISPLRNNCYPQKTVD
ncbi:MAG: amidophosphoribosyltransferase [Desulfobulbaceae bacterium]|nr:amidophosphoribosyltransferase [Desulfobulbaceae bacterium]